MKRLCKVLIAFAVAAGILIPASMAKAAASAPAYTAPHQAAAAKTSAMTSASAATASSNGCPSGYVCMYTTAGWSSGQPEHEYFQYGCYNLSNELGTRVIYNVQTGGATVTGYYNYGCSAPAWTFSPATAFGWRVDITPINSISLNP
jgi:hypothetical protein